MNNSLKNLSIQSPIVSFLTNYKVSFTGSSGANKLEKIPEKDVFEKKSDTNSCLKSKMLKLRDDYIKENPDAFITLDHIKSNYDNWHVLKSVENQTMDLQAVSTEDFCDLSEIMKSIRTPESITVYRAMEANDFNIGRISPEEFFEEYYSNGKKVIVPIYMSTSLDKNIAYRFAKNNPNRFIIKLNIPKNHPAVYMENLAPNDDEHYGNEEEINVIKNSEIVIKNLTKIKNPLNNKEIYQIEGDIVGFKDIKPKPKEEITFDDESLALLEALKAELGL